MTETAAKKDLQKLQRAIVDGLQDIKAQDIRVFNTEHLSPLFERVIVASGTSNRQTKALAASVRDKVREAGFDKPRTEGEENGEWIIVDCGAAVAHVMQPAIRSYYNLEEIWGEKPVRLKSAAPATRKAASTRSGAASAKATAPAAAKKASAKKAPVKKAAAKKAPATKSSSAKDQPAAAPAAKKTAAKKVPAKKAPAKKAPTRAAATSPSAPRAAKKATAAPRKSSALKSGA